MEAKNKIFSCFFYEKLSLIFLDTDINHSKLIFLTEWHVLLNVRHDLKQWGDFYCQCNGNRRCSECV